MGGVDPFSSEANGDAAYFLDRPADQWRRGCAVVLAKVRRLVFLGDGGFARWRIAAIMAKASMIHDDATRARICFHCDRARTRSSRSQNYPRSPSDDPRLLPVFRAMFPLDTKW